MPTGVYARPLRLCSIEECDNKYFCKGLCEKHFKKQANKKYQINNKQYLNEISKQYRLKNKEHILKYLKQWRQTPIGKASKKASSHNRRVMTKDLTKETVQRVYEDNIKKYGTLTCCLCDKPIAFGEDSLEHLTPLTRQGSNNFSNLGVAHLICNIRKQVMTLKEWKKKCNYK